MEKDYSIVDYFSEQSKHKCGYCKKSDTNATYGMWAQFLTVQDYQDLIDRGWRRSGKYCYKPIMDVTCCPMYTIRCEALNLKLSKSQKKILKRVNKFLSEGFKDKDNVSACSLENREDNVNSMEIERTVNKTMNDIDVSKIKTSHLYDGDSDNITSNKSNVTAACISSNMNAESTSSTDSSTVTFQSNSEKKCSFKPGQGPDATKPPCKKAKLMRLERKRQKLEAAGLTVDEIKTSTQNKQECKTLEQFISDIPEVTNHKLKVTLIRTDSESEEWLRTSKESFAVYRKYQMSIHKDPADKCTERQFTRFLVDSPLQLEFKRITVSEPTFKQSAELFAKYQRIVHKDPAEECDEDSYKDFLVETPLQPFYSQNGPPHGYGSFHQQYWLDGNLIAVGVIDILPKCVSSVYFFYDPDYGNLSLGTYGSLRELEFTRHLHQIVPEIEYYYMGYYIHSCPKMRYKANLVPSFLLCPETYNWFSAEKCIPKLNLSPYSRFNEDPDAVDVYRCNQEDINRVLILYDYTVMLYSHFKQRYSHDDDEILEYANLVGKKCAFRMFMYKD